MPVSNINDRTGPSIIQASRNTSQKSAFSRVLSGTAREKIAQPPQGGIAEAPAGRDPGPRAYIELGRISKETPTVSHILRAHPELSGKCWDIIFSPANRETDFTKMRDGTLVALRPESNEIIWGEKLAALADREHTAHSGAVDDRTVTPQSDGQLMVIGTISEEHPTVSHLFQANPGFDSRYWKIIHAPVNSAIQYRSLTPGTRIVLDTKTLQLSVHEKEHPAPAPQPVKTEGPELADKNEKLLYGTLAEAVKPFIGTPYEKIDCYGLIVRGLQNQGIQYRGHGGIREKLEALATRNGMPANAYFSGEGLVEKAGEKVYSRKLHSVSGSREKADEIYSEMIPYLREGFILSFSTPTRGHTGIIGRQGEEWTYINSGVIDNQVSPLKLSKGVGEEFLKAELNNWLVLAANKKEPLTVTLGHVGRHRS